MVDFAGAQSRNVISGPFPDPNVGTPVLPSIADQPYPPGPFSPVGATPTIVPFERVGTFNLPALGVDPEAPASVGPAQNGSVVAGEAQLLNVPPPPGKQVAGHLSRQIQDDWFENIIVFPRELDIGNVLSSQVRDVVVYNNYRNTQRTWTSFTNNAGQGVTVSGVPTLPTDLFALEAVLLQVAISTQGPPTINGTLDFVFDVGPDEVTVTGTRVILFPFQPESPMGETLEFNTDLMVSADGTEQRTSLLEGPRQSFDLPIRDDSSDQERDALNATLFDWQARLFGVPLWFEARNLTADVSIGGSIIPVATTEYGDFRVGGLVALGSTYKDFETFEVLVINPTSIEIQGQFAFDHQAIITQVMPVRLAYTNRSIDQSRFLPLTGLTDTSIKFTTIDNIDLSDASAFGTYNSKVLIDRLNKVSGRTVREGYNRVIERMNPGTGQIEQRSLWAKSKPRLNLGLDGDSLQETWEIRQLMHFLAGRRVSFYLGTGRDDFAVVVDVPDSSAQLDIAFINFTTFYQEVTPRSDLQIIRVDGTVSQHQITGSSIVTPGEVERLTISPVITPALPIADIKRVEFLTLSRLDSDDVSIEHARPGDSEFRVPTLGVFS